MKKINIVQCEKINKKRQFDHSSYFYQQYKNINVRYVCFRQVITEIEYNRSILSYELLPKCVTSGHQHHQVRRRTPSV